MRVTRLLALADLRARGIPFSRTYLLRLEKAQRFPARVRLGCNSVAWREDEIDRWVDERSAARGEQPVTPAAFELDAGR